ncbi:LuxR C-terminal-related transcriptional regulator [Catenulispora yoronensis]
MPSQYLDELLEALESGGLAVSDATLLTRVLLWHGRTEDTLRVFKRWSGGDLKADPEAAADLHITRAWLRSSFTPLLQHLPEAAPEPPAKPGAHPAATLGTTDLRHRLGASTALDQVLTTGPSHHVFEEAERVLRRSAPSGVGMDALESALLALVYGEQSARAASWCDKLLAAADRHESPSHRARLLALRAEISVRQGDLPAAERHARDGLALIPAANWGVTLGACFASLLTALTDMGRHEDAAELLSRPVPPAMLGSRYGLHYIRARGRHFLATDDPRSALTDFLACGDLMRTWQIDVPGLLPWRTDAAEALLATGAVDQARELLERQLELCDRKTHPRAHGEALRVLAATHELHLRPMLLRTAAEALKEGEDRYLLARALCDLTTAYLQLGETRRAQVIARQALSIAQACQAETVATRLAQDAGLTDPEPPPTPSAAVLSDAERRVADLVVHGLTNREIAKRLYITVSTVEQHLTHTYRKLGVAGRADLAVVGSRNGGVPALT